MGGRGEKIGGRNRSAGKVDFPYEVTYVDKESGGLLITEKGRIAQSEKGKQEMQKYEKEKDVCLTLAKNGHSVTHVSDVKKSKETFDIIIDGKKADIKCKSSANNISRNAHKATNSQGAQIVVFRFDKINSTVNFEINKLSDKGIHGYYFEKGSLKLMSF